MAAGSKGETNTGPCEVLPTFVKSCISVAGGVEVVVPVPPVPNTFASVASVTVLAEGMGSDSSSVFNSLIRPRVPHGPWEGMAAGHALSHRHAPLSAF